MTKTNTEAAVAAKTKAKKVLTEKDIPIGKLPTAAELKAEQARELAKEAKETGAPRARAELARGVASRHAPQSAKAVADANGKHKTANKADAVQAKGKVKSDAKAGAKAKVEARKAERESWTQDRKYKVIVKLADLTLRDGTWTKVMVETALGHKTTAEANAALAKHREFGSRKIDWKWLADSRKYIQF